MRGLKALMLLSTAAFSSPIFADELDPSMTTNVPAGLIVREDAQGNREAFKSTEMVTNDDEANLAINDVTTDNKVVISDELDLSTSKESWHLFHSWDLGYRRPYYGYNYYGDLHLYRPYYGYRRGPFSFFFYDLFRPRLGRHGRW